jgi:hypothetical protein
MKMKCLVLLLAIGALAGNAIADQPKSYRITLADVFHVGNTAFEPGEYKVVLDSPKIRFIHVKTNNTVELDARIENAEKKFAATEVHSKDVDGTNRISEIRLGGSKARLIFD